jgi:transcriptional regulator with XRE-family HTH domain
MSEAPKTPTSLARHLGATARQARLLADMSQEDVAELVDLATEVYGRLERGKMLPSVPTLVRLCRALTVDANSLLGIISSAEPPEWFTRDARLPGDSPTLRRLMRLARVLDQNHVQLLVALAHALRPDLAKKKHPLEKASTRKAGSKKAGADTDKAGAQDDGATALADTASAPK